MSDGGRLILSPWSGDGHVTHSGMEERLEGS